MKLVFATQNQHKAAEIQALLPSEFEVLTLNDINISEDIPETADTLEGNASQKSHYILRHYSLDCFSDDTGLEIKAINSEPGVYSARYAGPSKNADENMNKVLEKLAGKSDRTAQFRTVISLILEGKEHIFEGVVKGSIISEKRGTDGFGYDPIFVPEGQNKTFAELSLDEKNKMSHRARAFEKMIHFLKNDHLKHTM
ncbi:MAG: non-canonical purine NTP diphosphatase [Crocinitomicaceae bacterium]|nr:non-canonical purine NTP diphosphatase [Crocinitomicaceae bacterium]